MEHRLTKCTSRSCMGAATCVEKADPGVEKWAKLTCSARFQLIDVSSKRQATHDLSPASAARAGRFPVTGTPSPRSPNGDRIETRLLGITCMIWTDGRARTLGAGPTSDELGNATRAVALEAARRATGRVRQPSARFPERHFRTQFARLDSADGREAKLIRW